MTKAWGTVKEVSEHFGISKQRVLVLLKKGVFGKCKQLDTPRGMCWLIPKPFTRRELVNGVHTGAKEIREVELQKR